MSDSPVIQWDLLEGSAGQYGPKGWEGVTRVAHVSELVGTGQAKLFEAVTAVIADGVAPGAAHPQLPDVQVGTIRAEPAGPSAARVTVSYVSAGVDLGSDSGGGDNSSSLALADVEVGTRLSQVRTNLDANGATVDLSYTYPTSTADANYPHERPALAGQTVTTAAEWDALKPESTYSISRVEPNSPGAKSRAHTGHVNAFTFQGGGAGTWLCMGIVGRGPYHGPFTVGYEFWYKASGWNSEKAVFKRFDGAIPSDLVDNLGIKPVEKYPQSDFASLKVE